MVDHVPSGPILVRARKSKNPYRIHESVQLDIIDFIESGIGFSDEEVAAAYNVRPKDIAKLRQIIPLKEEYGVTSLSGRRATRHNRVPVPDSIKVEILTKNALAKLPSATVGLMYGVTCMAIHVLRRNRAKILRRYKLGHKDLRDSRKGSRDAIVPFDEEVLRWMDATPGCKVRHILDFARSIAAEYGKPPWFKATYGWWERFRRRYNITRFGELIADMEGYDYEDDSTRCVQNTIQIDHEPRTRGHSDEAILSSDDESVGGVSGDDGEQACVAMEDKVAAEKLDSEPPVSDDDSVAAVSDNVSDDKVDETPLAVGKAPQGDEKAGLYASEGDDACEIYPIKKPMLDRGIDDDCRDFQMDDCDSERARRAHAGKATMGQPEDGADVVSNNNLCKDDVHGDDRIARAGSSESLANEDKSPRDGGTCESHNEAPNDL